MKTILLLIPNLGYGGAQRVFHDHSVELGKKYKVYDCVFNKDDGIAYPTPNELLDLEVPGGGNIFQKIYNFWLRIYRLKKVKRKYKIDICISHLEGADYVNLLSRTGEKTIICVHGSKLHDKDISGVMGWVRKKVLMPVLYKMPDKIITVSRDINKELIDGFGVEANKITTINNFFEEEKIKNLAAVPLEEKYEAIFSSYKVLINSGRLTAQKNQEPLLHMMARLKSDKVTCKLLIVGDGDLRNHLILTGKNLGLNVYDVWNKDISLSPDFDVYFLGFHDNPFQFISKAHLFVFPSSWEGFPMALGEAMICGLPVLATDCPTGPREMLAPDSTVTLPISKPERGEYGVLLPLFTKENFLDNIENWVNQIKDFISDDALTSYYRQQAQRRMLDFSKELIFAKWVKVVEEL